MREEPAAVLERLLPLLADRARPTASTTAVVTAGAREVGRRRQHNPLEGTDQSLVGT